MTRARLLPATPPRSTARADRIDALDVIRGFALCGILLVNIEPVTGFQYALPHPPANLGDPSGWLQLLVQQRFFPIFSLLFGIGFSLFLASAGGRHPRPRLLLLRRLAVLLPLGVAHQFLHPGEALTYYALGGLLVLLPASFLPRWISAAGSATLIAASILLAGGGLTLIPGAFLLGSTLVRYGVVRRFATARRGPAILFALFALTAVPAVIWQLQDLKNSDFNISSAVAGICLAGAYTTGLLLLLQTPVSRALRTVFAPFGRMALSNYVLATPVMVAAGMLLDLPSSRSWSLVLGIGIGILAVQWILSTLWLRRFRQGPLEWLWRCATWANMQPLRLRDRDTGAARAVPTVSGSEPAARAERA